MKREINLLVALLLYSGVALAQQQALFTQYMFNPLVINPAVAGSEDAINFTAAVRQQWSGIQGAPKTQSFTVDMPIPEKKMGVGLTVLNDKIGVTNETGAMASYAYRLPLTKRKYSKQKGRFIHPSHLSMGLQAGFSRYDNDLSRLVTDAAPGSQPDNLFLNNDISRSLFNFGFGMLYRMEVVYVGVSSPNLISNAYNDITDGARQAKHYYVTMGTTYTVNRSIQVQPNLLFKIVEGAPLQVDINTNMVYNKVLWLGASYRSRESVDLLIQMQLTEKLRFGYSFDLLVNELAQSLGNSHEFLLNFRLPALQRKKECVNPRYF